MVAVVGGDALYWMVAVAVVIVDGAISGILMMRVVGVLSH
jgi:hypothetical protein